MLRLSLLFVLSSFPLVAGEFKVGSQFSLERKSGILHCVKDSEAIVEMNCLKERLYPKSVTRFIDSEKRGKKVILVRRNNKDGEVRKRVLIYKKGKSKKVRIWPFEVNDPNAFYFLEVGVNKVFYAIKDAEKKILSKGKFEVDVELISEKRCASKVLELGATCRYKPSACYHYWLGQPDCEE